MSGRPIALVTGASGGIGKGLVEWLAGNGWAVIGCSRRIVDTAGAAYQHHAVDVTDESAVRTLMQDVRARYGQLDVLVNAAGIGVAALAMLTPIEEMERALRTNVLGTMLMCREAAQLMAERRYGRIINIASVAVPLVMDGSSVYGATKAAVIQFTKVLAKELARFGVTCNVVAPSLVDTDMARSLRPQVREKYLAGLTIGRMGTIEDVANAVSFFARPESGYVTGQVLYLGLVS